MVIKRRVYGVITYQFKHHGPLSSREPISFPQHLFCVSMFDVAEGWDHMPILSATLNFSVIIPASYL